MDLSIKTLRYNPLIGQVQVGIVGELGDRIVQIAIEFPFRAGGPPEVAMREVALLEAQQILRAAATVSLPSLLADEVPQPASTENPSGPRRYWRYRGAARLH
jgi:hypothetical protein